jgi:hypothetical protein
MKRSALVVSAVLGLVLAAGAAAAQPESTEEQLRLLRRDIESLREGQGRIQKDVQEIKTLLQRLSRGERADEPPLQDIVLSAGDGEGKGVESARLVLVDFTDYQ